MRLFNKKEAQSLARTFAKRAKECRAIAEQKLPHLTKAEQRMVRNTWLNDAEKFEAHVTSIRAQIKSGASSIKI